MAVDAAEGKAPSDLRWWWSRSTNELGRAFVDECIANSERLRRILLVCGRWGTARARAEAANALVGLATPIPQASGFIFWHSLRNVPAMLCFYWYNIGALASADYRAVQQMFATKLSKRPLRDTLPAALPPGHYDSVNDWKFLNDRQEYKLPASRYFGRLIDAEVGDVARTAEEGDVLFDTLEMLIALELAHRRLAQIKASAIGHFWVPVGKFVWREDASPSLRDFETLRPDSAFLTAGFFGGTADGAKAAVEAVNDHLSRTNLRW